MKNRTEWSAKEDGELRKGVLVHGEGSWKAILEQSEVLKRRYALGDDERARDSLRGRWDTLSNKRQGGRKLRQPWTKKEDDALASEVLEHGTNWKDILENNRMFQAKYGHMKVEKARGALKDRWQTVRPSYDHVVAKKTATSKTGARNPLSAITGNKTCTRTQNKPQAIKRRRKKLGREVALQNNRFSDMILLGI